MATNPKRLCFVHVPKCGGTSLNEAFKKSVGISSLSLRGVKIDAAKTMKEAKRKNMNTLALRQEKLISKLQNKRFRYVKGHVRCTSEVRAQFEKDWVFVTVMRDPVKRWISQYFFNLHKTNPHTKHDLALDEYLESDIARTSGAIYLDFFTNGEDLTSDKAAKEAIANIEAFPLVGVLEKKDAFKDRFKEIMGTELQTIGNRNTNPLSKDQMKKQVSDAQMAKIREFCAPDLQVYEHFANALK